MSSERLSAEKVASSSRRLLIGVAVLAAANLTWLGPKALDFFMGRGVEHGVLPLTYPEEDASLKPLRPSRYGLVHYGRKWDWSLTDQAQGDQGKSGWVIGAEAYRASQVK